jgi:hypothetical protein
MEEVSSFHLLCLEICDIMHKIKLNLRNAYVSPQIILE